MTNNPVIKYILDNHVLSTVIIVALVFLVIELKSIVIALFTAYIIMASLNPFVKFLTKRKVPKIFSTLIVFGFVLAFIVLLVIPILPFFVSQMQYFIEQIPNYINLASKSIGIQLNNNDLNSIIVPLAGSIGKNALQITKTVFGGIFSFISIFILSFYLLLERDKLINSVSKFLLPTNEEKIKNTIELVEEKLGAWLRGQVALSLTIGVVTWLILTIIGVEFALPLAILAGFLEIIPTLGPIIASIPAIIVALAISPIMALAVILAYTLIQLAENNFLVPKIMQKAVGLNPIVIIIAILVGGNLLGIMGALLSIPFLSVVIIILKRIKD